MLADRGSRSALARGVVPRLHEHAERRGHRATCSSVRRLQCVVVHLSALIDASPSPVRHSEYIYCGNTCLVGSPSALRLPCWRTEAVEVLLREVSSRDYTNMPKGVAIVQRVLLCVVYNASSCI
ncbi:hypothetical protein Tcan_06167 [Toxocara canis]|uniref:Uncharacterized protein n=1 Tax=Toxocara canis TaxID=6265 RepID=A0A0B2V729_TOXCA|nr:hypothetical protein Tcan_06167 [Toxocara canis]